MKSLSSPTMKSWSTFSDLFTTTRSSRRRRLNGTRQRTDGIVPTIEKLEDRTLLTINTIFGDAALHDNRIDILFLGDGYTQADYDNGVFDQHVQVMVDHLFDPSTGQVPYNRYMNYFNIFTITDIPEVVSMESGALVPEAPRVDINGAHSMSDTTIRVDDASGYSSQVPFDIRIGNEVMSVTDVNVFSDILTVVRGVSGTTPAAHADNAEVRTIPKFVNNALQSSYRGGPNFFPGPSSRAEIELRVDTNLASQAINRARNFATQLGEIPFNFREDIVIITVNDTIHGGSSGGLFGASTGSYYTYAGGAPLSADLALREMSFRFHQLGEELDTNPNVTNYATSDPEPFFPNVARAGGGGQKWGQWFGFNQPGIGAINEFLGTIDFDNLVHPSFNSKLGTPLMFGEQPRPFDAIAREDIILDFYGYVDPIESFSLNTVAFADPDQDLSVSVVDTNVVQVEWLVNGIIEPGAFNLLTFNPADFGYGVGDFSVTARVTDPAGLGSFAGGLDWVRSDPQGVLDYEVSWNFEVPAIGVPTLISPVGTLNFPVTNPPIYTSNPPVTSALPTFMWTAVPGAERYEITVDDLHTGERIVRRNDIPGSSTEFTPSSAVNKPEFTVGHSYRWWVRAIASDGTVGVLSTDGNFTLREAGIGIPTPIGPTGTTADATPTFTWSPAFEATRYELLVEDVSDPVNPVVVIRNSSIQSLEYTPTTPLKSGTTYSWQVRGFSSIGTVGVFSSRQQFTVQEVAVGTPTIISPTATITDSTPTFTWTAATGADLYEIAVTDLTTGTSGVISRKDIVGTSFTATTELISGDTYQWRVRGISSTGTIGAWSSNQNFRIQVEAIGTPALAAPSATASSARPTFQWTAVPNAARYELWVNDSSTGRRILYNANVNGTTYQPAQPLTDGPNYRWWVRAHTAMGTEGLWSTPLNFSVPIPVGTATLLSPTGTVTDNTPTFQWSQVSGASRYELWVTDVNSQQRILHQTNLTTTSYTPTTALNGGPSYRWWIRAYDSAGSAGAWSSLQSFNLPVAVGTPTLVSPTATIDADTTIVFQWTDVAGADSYELWINDVADNRRVLLAKNISGSTYTPNVPLVGGRNFEWWVRAVSSSGAAGKWSSSETFAVPIAVGTPTLISPTGTTINATPNFQWTAVNGADHYQLWVTDRVTGQRVLYNENVTGTSFQATQALTGLQHRWWVRAVSPTGIAGDWSSFQDFNITVTSVSPPPKASDAPALQNEELEAAGSTADGEELSGETVVVVVQSQTSQEVVQVDDQTAGVAVVDLDVVMADWQLTEWDESVEANDLADLLASQATVVETAKAEPALSSQAAFVLGLPLLLGRSIRRFARRRNLRRDED